MINMEFSISDSISFDFSVSGAAVPASTGTVISGIMIPNFNGILDDDMLNGVAEIAEE